ncbi:MAG: hypothetical protein QXX01_01875 [Candidatus Aenigmatarchaeota archaeon]|nr:hypothetical protein [Candidatus Aenigmarchaeota archaeon]
MRGINILVSHTLYLAISFGLLSALFGAYIYTTYNWENNLKNEELKEVAYSIKSQISDLSTYYFDNFTIEKRLNIKNYIGNKQYKIEFKNKTIKISQDDNFVEVNVSNDFELTGVAFAPAKIIYKFPEKTIEIKGV